MYSWPRHKLELSGQLRAPAALAPEERAPGTPWRGEKSYPCRDSNSDHSTIQLVLTELSRLVLMMEAVWKICFLPDYTVSLPRRCNSEQCFFFRRMLNDIKGNIISSSASMSVLWLTLQQINYQANNKRKGQFWSTHFLYIREMSPHAFPKPCLALLFSRIP
jgi:hypothetical protein